MDEWLDRYAAALGADGDRPRLDAETAGVLLRLARDVAHGTERKNAPLATFLAGQHVATRMRDGVEAVAAAREALVAASALLDSKVDRD